VFVLYVHVADVFIGFNAPVRVLKDSLKSASPLTVTQATPQHVMTSAWTPGSVRSTTCSSSNSGRKAIRFPGTCFACWRCRQSTQNGKFKPTETPPGLVDGDHDAVARGC
jgi:hypothetical protein